MRREYKINLTVNGRHLNRGIIDAHYESKHARTINDRIILELVGLLDDHEFRPVDIDEEGFEYYVIDNMHHKRRLYRLIWLLHPKENYLGVINAFRRK